MGWCAKKIADLNTKSTVHPIVERLTAGLAVYSQSFAADFWLVYKNTHIVVSCFACHPEHYFDRGERYNVFLVSAFIAFGCTGIFNFVAKSEDCKNVGGFRDQSPEWQACMTNFNFTPTVGTTITWSIVSSLLQMFFDQFGQFVVTCACVQTCPMWIKACAEGLGKIAFWILCFLGAVFLTVGGALIGYLGLDAGASFLQFLIQRVINFLIITSAVTFVSYFLARRGQMKPAADVLATEAGKKKWEEPAGLPIPCVKKKAPCELWNKFHGEDKHFVDLPEKPFDYDYELKIALCVFCYSKTCCKVTAKNPDPLDAKDPEAPPPTIPPQMTMDGTKESELRLESAA